MIEARGTDDAQLEFDDYSLVAGEAEKCHVAIGVTHATYLRIPKAMSDDNLDAIHPWWSGSPAMAWWVKSADN